MKIGAQLTSMALATNLFAQTALATEDCFNDAMIVFDGSGSMSESGYSGAEFPRIVDAQLAMELSLPEIARVRKLGLVIYGPGVYGGCQNIYLRFPPVENAAQRIISEVEGIDPSGLTPLTVAVERAAEALDYRNRPAVVVLITDGDETCGGAPCQVSERMELIGDDLTIHVIAFRARYSGYAHDIPDDGKGSSATVARCLAENTGGKHVTTETVAELVAAMTETLGCQLIGTVRKPVEILNSG